MVVLGVGPHVGDPCAVLGLGSCYSWLGARWPALLAGLPASPAGAFDDADGEGAVGDVLGVEVADDAGDEAAAGHATVVAVSGDAYGEGVAGDAPGDVVGERGVGGAPGVGVAADVNGEDATGDALVDGVSCDALMVTVLLVMVLGVGPCRGGRRRFWACGLATPGGGPGGRWWSVGGRLARRSWRCWLPLVSGQLLANPGVGCCW